MSDTDFLMLFTKFSGFRLLVLANRLGCETGFQREIHDNLVEVLNGLAGTMRHFMRESRMLQTADLSDEDNAIDHYLLNERLKMFKEQGYELLDELEIDADTMEYRVNGGGWSCAYSEVCDGHEISYPRAVAVGRDELGSLIDIIADINRETYAGISVRRVVYD